MIFCGTNSCCLLLRGCTRLTRNHGASFFIPSVQSSSTQYSVDSVGDGRNRHPSERPHPDQSRRIMTLLMQSPEKKYFTDKRKKMADTGLYNVKNLSIWQDCTERYKKILSQRELGTLDFDALDILQKKIWDKHALKLSFEELFDLIERSCIHQYNSHYLERALLMRATEKFDSFDWDSASLTRLMFAVIRLKQGPHSLLDRVQTCIGLHLDSFSHKQLALILMGFYVARFTYVELIGDRVGEKILNDLDKMERAEFFYLLKGLRFRGVNAGYYLRLATLLRGETLKKKCVKLVDMAYLLKPYALLRVSDTNFIKDVLSLLNDFTENLDNMRYKDLAVVSWALGTLAYDVENSSGIYSTLEQTYLYGTRSAERSSLVRIHRNIDFFFGLVVAEKFPPIFIDFMKETNVEELLEQFEKNLFESRDVLLVLLRVCVDIECPEVNLMELPKGFIKWRLRHSTTYFLSDLEDITEIMNETLGQELARCHRLLPYSSACVEIHLDENNRPVAFEPYQYEDMLEERKDEQAISKRHRRIMIVFTTKKTMLRTTSHFQHSDKPNGFMLVQFRHLKKLGFEICVVTYFEVSFPDKLNKSQKAMYVMEKLKKEHGMQIDSDEEYLE